MELLNLLKNLWTKSPEAERSFECTWERAKQSVRHSQSPNWICRMPAGFFLKDCSVFILP